MNSFRPLTEDSCHEDQFEAGAHSAVADDIYNLMKSGKEGLTIGLEGSWGTGKTTILSLLRGKIEKDISNGLKDTFIFSFDAWAHEGDPLKRIFIESLATAAKEKIEDERLDKIIKKSSGREKTISVESTRRISNTGILLMICSMLIPVGAFMMATLDAKSISMPWQQNSGRLNITALLSIILISSPLIALIAEFFVRLVLNRKIPSFRIIDPNHQDTVLKNISDDSERTSIEFQKYFTDLVSVITDSENERFGKLVIVIDNIDRLSHEHIRQSWATMQAFLQHRNSASQGKFLEKKVWFILPYDRDILAEALEPPEKQEITPSHIDSPISFLQRNTSSRRLMALEKSIQIQVETPEPVMSGWAKYLDACIDSALDWSPEEIEKVKETCKKCLASVHSSPTPRFIKNLINQIGFFGTRWKNTVGVDSIAIYSWLRTHKNKLDIRKDLTGNNDAFARWRPESERVRSEIVSLLFGLPKEHALEVFLGDEIRDALLQGGSSAIQAKDGQPSSLADLERSYPEGFWIAWHSTWPTVRPGESHDHEWLIAITVNIGEGLLQYRRDIRDAVQDLESAWRHTSQDWKLESHEYAKALQAMTLLTERNDIAETFSSHILSYIEEYFAKNEGRFSEESFCEIEKVFKCMASLGVPPEKLKLKKSHSTTWASWSELAYKNKALLDFISPTEDVIRDIVPSASNSPANIIQGSFKSLVMAIRSDPKGKTWEPVAERIANTANWRAKNNPEHLSEIFFWVYLHSNSTIRRRIDSEYVGNSSIKDVKVIGSFERSPYFYLMVALCHGDKIDQAPHLPRRIVEFWTKNDEQNAEIIVKKIKEDGIPEELFCMKNFMQLELSKTAKEKARDDSV
jgi:hypothetical protein